MDLSRFAGLLFSELKVPLYAPAPADSCAHRAVHLEPVPSAVGLPNPGIEPGSPAFQADSFPTELSGKPRVVTTPIRHLHRQTAYSEGITRRQSELEMIVPRELGFSDLPTVIDLSTLLAFMTPGES